MTIRLVREYIVPYRPLELLAKRLLHAWLSAHSVTVWDGEDWIRVADPNRLGRADYTVEAADMRAMLNV